MKRFSIPGILLAALALAAPAEQQSRVASAGLFKNGLAVITKEYTVPGPGTYTFEALGKPVHGTLWIESEGAVAARSGTEETEADPEAFAAAGLQEALTGKRVEIGLRLEGSTPFTGTLIAAPGGGVQDRRELDRSGGFVVHPSPSSSMYVIENAGNRSYVAQDLVAYVRSLEPAGAIRRMKPVLTFEVGEGSPRPTVIRARYLAQGMSWAPSYRIDLTDANTLSIGQSAVIRNELEDMDDIEVELISGFPNVEFLRAVSPFSANTTWANFMSQLQQQVAWADPSAVQMASTSNSSQLFSNEADVLAATQPLPAYSLDEGGDLYYHQAGVQSLRQGAALLLTTAEAQADYERIVEWRVNRTPRESAGGSLGQNDIWDALRFRNPFPFPMTTGPAMVESKGRFLGSKTIFWAGPGGETVAYVSKALSVRAGYTEEEIARGEVLELKRPVIETVIKGTLKVQNPRTEAVNLVIREDLPGEVLRADGEPAITVGAAGPGQRNPSTKLIWKLTLEVGEERELMLEYKYLID